MVPQLGPQGQGQEFGVVVAREAGGATVRIAREHAAFDT
jgi:hypothetical protein